MLPGTGTGEILVVKLDPHAEDKDNKNLRSLLSVIIFSASYCGTRSANFTASFGGQLLYFIIDSMKNKDKILFRALPVVFCTRIVGYPFIVTVNIKPLKQPFIVM